MSDVIQLWGRIAALALVLAAILTSQSVQGQAAYEEALLAAVNADSLMDTVRKLTGELPVNVGGVEDTIRSRFEGTPGNALAADWIAQELARYGLDVEQQPFSYAGGQSGVNVIGYLPGTMPDGPLVMICAHYDAVNGAPGADDNASGTAAVIQAARVLAGEPFQSGVEFYYGIVFALWDGEEWGLFGSREYALEAFINGIQFEGIVNLDMIGWDGDGDRVFEIHSNVGSLTTMFVELPEDLGLPLIPLVAPEPTTRSDHAAFWEYEYPSMLLVEEIFPDSTSAVNQNPFYHQPSDSSATLDPEFYADMARLATIGVARLARPQPVDVNMESESVFPNAHVSVYPNPAMGRAIIEFSLSGPTSVMLEVYDLWGRLVHQQTARAVGHTREELDISELSPGIYYVRVSTDSDQLVTRLVVAR